MLTSRIGRPSGIDEKRLVDFKPLRAEIYFAEKKILATLPKMEKAAQSAELKGNSLWVLFNHSGQNDYFAAPRQPKVRAVSTVTLGKVY